jgi:cytoskeleton protein RodZ
VSWYNTMDELGTILQETREARNLTLEDVAQVTRIRVRYLEALEEGRYDVLPTPVHVRGFLRNYAIFLNLDPEPLIARYNASRKVVRDIPVSKQVRPELGRAAPQPPETLEDELQPEPVFFRPLGSNLQTPAWFSGDILIGIFVIVILLGFIGFAGARFLLPAITQARATETLEATTETVTPEPTDSPPAVVALATEPAVQLTDEPTRPLILSDLQLDVTVVERSWLKVIVDGETVQEGMVRPGDLFSWQGNDQVNLVTGNGAGIEATLNGQPLGALGGRGEVVEKIWTLSGEVAPTPTLTPSPTSEATEPAEPANATPEPAGG